MIMSFMPPSLSEEMFVVMMLVIGGLITIATVAIGCTLLGVINACHKRDSVNKLKHELLERGYSPEEVIALIEATPLPTGGLDRYLATRAKRG